MVGNSGAATASDFAAFVWSEGTGMRNLNDLIDPALGWSLSAATAINNKGQIVGYGDRAGVTHAFLLNPIAVAVPEPASRGMMMLGFGVVGAALRRRSPARAEVTRRGGGR